MILERDYSLFFINKTYLLKVSSLLLCYFHYSGAAVENKCAVVLIEKTVCVVPDFRTQKCCAIPAPAVILVNAREKQQLAELLSLFSSSHA